MTAATAPTEAGGTPRLVLVIRMLIVVVAVAALLSPLYVALRGSAFLNQAPPPFFGVNAGTPPAAGGTTPGHKTAGFGGC